MSIKKFQQSLVIVANQVNPSILTPQWLMRQEIIPADAIREGSIAGSHMVQLSTADLELLILPDRIQFTPTCEENRQYEAIMPIITGIARTLLHTPFAAVGVNFHYLVTFPGRNYRELNRQLMFHDSPISRNFTDENARFGAYFSRNILGFRLKLDTKPSTLVQPEEGETEGISLHFNYHGPISEEADRAEIVIAFAERWNELRAFADQVVQSVQDIQ